MALVIGITSSTIQAPDLPGVRRMAIVRAYLEGVTRAGGLPLGLPNAAPGTAPEYLRLLDGVLLSGGVDIDPDHYGQEPKPAMGSVDHVRDAFEIALVREAHAAGVPVLAICRGIQVLNVALGGTLVQDIPSEVEGGFGHDLKTAHPDALAHWVDVVPDTRLHAIAGATRVRVNSFHHQSADRVPPPLAVTARSADGVVEGLEDPAHPFFVGVQWHPERRLEDPLSRALFEALVAAARQRKALGACRV